MTFSYLGRLAFCFALLSFAILSAGKTLPHNGRQLERRGNVTIPKYIPINPMTRQTAAKLSVLAYTDENSPSTQKANIAIALQNMTADQNGPYTLLWGPATNNGIMSFVSQGMDGTYALTFRGSLTNDTDGIGMMWNWADNLLALVLVPWSYPHGKDVKSRPELSAGMNDAFGMAVASTDPDSGLSMIDYLRDQINRAPAPIMLTGHSSGGAMANLATLWLADQLPRAGGPPRTAFPISTFTFAAPTVTNEIFAYMFYRTAVRTYRAVNTFDIVPMAWHNLTGVLNTFPAPGQSIYDYSKTLWFGVQAMKAMAVNLTLLPIGGVIDEFQGPVPLAQDFLTEVQRQHSMHGTYWQHSIGDPMR